MAKNLTGQNRPVS